MYHYKNEINEKIEKSNLKPVPMKGLYDELKKLKPIIEEIFEKRVYLMGYALCDAPFHGWTDEEVMANMTTITHGIEEHFVEIYALILAGLGEKMEDDK